MSKGLGWLQREILATLAVSQSEPCRGWDHWYDWTIAHGRTVRLAPGVYDLRRNLMYLARRHRRLAACQSYASGSFQAAHSRAVRGLIKRGLFKVHNSLVPISASEKGPEPYDNRVLLLSDGLYLNTNGQQRRFVSVMYTCQNLPS